MRRCCYVEAVCLCVCVVSESSVNVKEIVEQVRRQRPGMVQTEMQYKFLYDVIPHIVAAQNTVCLLTRMFRSASFYSRCLT